jgi:2-polyprenyl-6-hydroxyphenyl methylase/3-demethylubiquinone-9 3-methyltransferase
LRKGDPDAPCLTREEPIVVLHYQPSGDPARGLTASGEEIGRFGRLADAWWDPHGEFRPLHQLNPVRVAYIRDAAVRHFGLDPSASQPLAGLSMIDIGCGGGLVAEAFARLGGRLIGIDASAESVRVAELHARREGLDIRYRCAVPEDLASDGERFDAVLALEVVEHVADLDRFVEACAALRTPGGMMVFATLNRTLKSLALAKIGAEYVLRWLPPGTHDWRKFVRPSELAAILRRHQLDMSDLAGVTYDPLRGSWSLSRDLEVNYMGVAV